MNLSMVKTDEAFESDAAVPLFKLDSINDIRYDVSPDGQRFLISTRERGALCRRRLQSS